MGTAGDLRILLADDDTQFAPRSSTSRHVRAASAVLPLTFSSPLVAAFRVVFGRWFARPVFTRARALCFALTVLCANLLGVFADPHSHLVCLCVRSPLLPARSPMPFRTSLAMFLCTSIAVTMVRRSF